MSTKNSTTINSAQLPPLAVRLRSARESAGLSQKALAMACGLSQTNISELERGESIRTAYLPELARGCGVTADWLAFGTPQGQQLPAPSVEVQFALGNVGFSVNSSASGGEALRVATYLSEAAALLSERICDDINAGDSGHCSEMSALGFLAETCSALIRHARRDNSGEGGAK